MKATTRAGRAASPSSSRRARCSTNPARRFEHEVARAGHYPESRNKKGIEAEGAEVATLRRRQLFFIGAERASIVGVYKDTGAEPEFLQLLPSGISPEGLVAIPSRNLLVTANEVDLVEDGGARSHVMIYELAEGDAGLSDDRLGDAG